MKVCIVGLGSLPLWLKSEKKRTGGAEFQTYLISSKLEKFCEVCRVTEDSKKLTNNVSEEFNILPSYLPGSGIKYLRFFYPRFSNIWKALKLADADVYYQRAAGSITGIVALFCRLHGKQFVYGMANDNEFDEKRWRKSMYTRIDEKMFAFGIRHASQIVVQNDVQSQLIRKHLSKDTLMIRNIYDGPRLGEARTDAGDYVLNVGNILPKKQHHLLLDLAEKFPHIPFKVAGGGSGAYFDGVMERASNLPNVEMLGFLSREQVLQVYQGARLMLHTAHTEGFPNVFLEAWGHGIPVLSLELDPAGVLSQKNLGWVASDVPDLERRLEQVWETTDTWENIRVAASEYLAEFHDPDLIARKYAELFSELVEP